MKQFKYSLSTTYESVSAFAPIMLRGDLFDNIDRAKRIGYDAIEMQLRNADEVDIPKLKQYLNEQGMGVSALATGMEYTMSGLCMISDDEQNREQLKQKMFAHIDLAAAIDTTVVVGSARGNIPDPSQLDFYLDRYKTELLKYADYAEEKNVLLVVEAINFYINNYLNSIEETCEFIESLGRKNIRLHMDTHHMNIEDYDILEAARRGAGLTGYVHFCEINRLYPGAGNLPFKEIMEILDDANYDGYLALECIPRPDQETAAQKGLDYLKKMEG